MARTTKPSILRTPGENTQFILKEIKSQKIEHIDIATFGLWTGIDAAGKPTEDSKEENSILQLLDQLEESDIFTRIVVGVPPFYSRTPPFLPPCLYCANSHRRMFQRLFHNRKKWRSIQWAFHKNSHTKLTIAYLEGKPQWALVGGHNLSQSNFEDISLVIQDPKQLKELSKIYQNLYQEADPDSGALLLEFEKEAANAQTPPPPKSQPPFNKEEVIPSKPLSQPSATGLTKFLLALAKEEFLEREDFSTHSRVYSTFIDQENRVLREKTPKTIANNPQVKRALKLYQSKKP